MGMIRVNFYVSGDVIARFDAMAARSGRNRSLLLRSAIEAGESVVSDIVSDIVRKSSGRGANAAGGRSALDILSGRAPDVPLAAPAAPAAVSAGDVPLGDIVRDVLRNMPSASPAEQRKAVIAALPQGALGSETDQRVEEAIKLMFSESEVSERNFTLPEE